MHLSHLVQNWKSEHSIPDYTCKQMRKCGFLLREFVMWLRSQKAQITRVDNMSLFGEKRLQVSLSLKYCYFSNVNVKLRPFFGAPDGWVFLRVWGKCRQGSPGGPVWWTWPKGNPSPCPNQPPSQRPYFN